MRKIGLQLLMGIIVAFSVASCLSTGNDNPNMEPTLEEKQFELENYLEKLIEEEYDIDTTELGVYYVVIDEGEGVYPVNGDTLTVAYSGYFVDGTLFDASNLHKEDGMFKFILNEPPMIPGWDDGMKVINKGAKVQLIVPSPLAYGSEGSGIIGPHENLIFVIQLVEHNPR